MRFILTCFMSFLVIGCLLGNSFSLTYCMPSVCEEVEVVHGCEGDISHHVSCAEVHSCSSHCELGSHEHIKVQVGVSEGTVAQSYLKVPVPVVTDLGLLLFLELVQEPVVDSVRQADYPCVDVGAVLTSERLAKESIVLLI